MTAPRQPAASHHRFGPWTPYESLLAAGGIAIWLTAAACAPASPPAQDVAPSSGTPTVRFLDPPAGDGAMAPSLTVADGGVLLSWLQPVDGGGHALLAAELLGEQWGPARTITTGDDFFANWADLPAIAATADLRYSHWLKKLGSDTYAYGAELARSADAGVTWEDLGLLHDDNAATEHGFVSYVVLGDGSVQVFWLDGRAMPEGGSMQLRTGLLSDVAPVTSTLLDDRVCECCATDAALAAAGPVVAYRNRSDAEIRDIAVVRATAEGWSEPVIVHDDGWEIFGCPVNGPAIAAAEGEQVVVAWFTGREPQPRVSVAFSNDGGASFGTPVVVDDARPVGRVDVDLDTQGRALVSWVGAAGRGAEIRWRRVAADGSAEPVQVVAASSALRSAGFPRMVRRGNELLFAWVEGSEPSRVRVGQIGLE